MSSKPSKWLFDITGGRHKRNWRELSVAGFIFTYVQKYLSVSLTGEIAPSPPMDLPLIEIRAGVQTRERGRGRLAGNQRRLDRNCRRVCCSGRVVRAAPAGGN